MLKNPKTRRRVSLSLLAAGGAVFLLTPENALASLLFVGLGILLEVLGIALGHSGRA